MTSFDASAEDQGPRGTSAGGGRRPVPFDLKGTMAPLTVLRLRSLDLAIVERHLRIKIAQLPQLFLNAPVLVDVGALAGQGAGLAIEELVRTLRSCKLVPVAIANLAEELRDRAVAAGLGIMMQQAARPRGDDRGAAAPSASMDPVEAIPAPGPARAPSQGGPASRAGGLAPVPGATVHSGPMVITQPVRSGQVVYAQNADLVVLAPVNPGAQIYADGHIHVYSTLRGRAMAGAQGLTDARIFVQKLEAELVAIAGAYVMADDIPSDRRGRPSQVFLEKGECRILPL